MIEDKRKNLDIFRDIVGDSPMKEIDYIIEHGMKKYNKLYSSLMNCTIKKNSKEDIHKDLKPKLVEIPEVIYKDNNTIEVKKKTIVKETCYVYGGQGNSKLWSWDYGRVNDELDTIRDDLDIIDDDLKVIEIKNNQLNNEINDLKVLTDTINNDILITVDR